MITNEPFLVVTKFHGFLERGHRNECYTYTYVKKICVSIGFGHSQVEQTRFQYRVHTIRAIVTRSGKDIEWCSGPISPNFALFPLSFKRVSFL